MKTTLFTVLLAIVATLFFAPQGQAQLTRKATDNLRPNNSVADAVAGRRMTTFDPSKHGFAFENTFQTELFLQDMRFGGLCGGMAYASLDNYFANQEAPKQTFRPAVKTPLFERIYSRQQTSTMTNVDKWAELFVNPVGSRTDEFFRWGLQKTGGGRLEELCKLIDQGKPCPLGLFKGGNGGTGPHHQVVAYGYELGRYKGDLGQHQTDLKIFIYDPNKSGKMMTLVPNLTKKSYYYVEDPNCEWMTYFVDLKYSAMSPLRIPASTYPNDNKVHELLVEVMTGGDDLRGGNDNLNMHIVLKNGTRETHANVNNRGRWINNYSETVKLKLRTPVKLEDIDCIELQTTFGGGIGGDNWNMDCIRIMANIGGRGERLIFEQSGAPLQRFDGNNRPYKATIR
ncbi:MAG: hypothetical protein Q8M16_10165 [Pirellulaceae bacterium]|nr:hypothetical protein [Pirellulaceae bacterium]